VPSVGQVLAGRYRLERFLGAGSMGSVWAAVHLELDAPVAIKLELPTAATSGRTHASRREARAAARLRSPHVVQTFDFGIDDGVPFIAMELLVGESLRARLDSVTRLSPCEASELVRQAASALDLAHRGRIVHRDIKPSNLFLVREGGRESIKVLDFGVAKWLDADAAESRTDSARLVGSAAYMSPEQARGQAVDHRSDIWSLAVVAYEMLFGARPFSGSNIPETLSKICGGVYRSPSDYAGREYAALDPVFVRGLHPEPTRRFQTAAELSRALADAVQSLPAGELRLQSCGDERGEAGLGRNAETASFRVDAAASRDPQLRLRARSVLGVLLGASLVGGALFTRSLLSREDSRAPSVAQALGGSGPTLPVLTVAVAAPVPPGRSGPMGRAAEVSTALVESASAAAVARRAAQDGSAPARSKPTTRSVPSAAPASSHLDPLFGLEVPAP
jgi:eukaryotic-like serine/threonine-protein kinase